jgi:dynein heavy chain
MTILDALKRRDLMFDFMEEKIALVDSVGFFITMNPGYAGRTELPENLKALFRLCAMVVSDIALICENMLMSEGFQTAEILAKKFVTLYDLSKALLSKQRHYDWGLCTVKSVLRQTSKLRRADPDVEEDPLLKRALRDFNLPKIVTDDREISKNLIDDLFPGVKVTDKFDAELKKLVIVAAKQLGYNTSEDGFALKCVQLSEILEVRHCCFVIGPTGSAKSSVWKVLAQTYINRGQDTELDTLNPKAVTSNELFGALSKSKEWKDGVLSVIMRNQYKNLDKYKPSHVLKWVILDGDIDPEWIESLNTVMDDNKILTLFSNERVPLSNSMRLLFEISNLRNATPATVSRGGVLFINGTDVGVRPYYES